MTLRKTFRLAAAIALVSGFSLVHAADLAGHWTAEFESPIGPQKYTYDFKTDGDKTTGKATYEHSMGKGESELADIKLSGDDVSFTESVKIQDNDLKITYKGKISGDEMKLSREVGEFGTEQLVAKRSSAPAPSPKPAEKK
jgi:hypothetical protein